MDRETCYQLLASFNVPPRLLNSVHTENTQVWEGLVLKFCWQAETPLLPVDESKQELMRAEGPKEHPIQFIQT